MLRGRSGVPAGEKRVERTPSGAEGAVGVFCCGRDDDVPSVAADAGGNAGKLRAEPFAFGARFCSSSVLLSSPPVGCLSLGHSVWAMVARKASGTLGLGDPGRL